MIDQEFVKYIVSSLVSKPDKVRVDRIMDERGVLLTLHVDEEDLGRVIGRKGSTAQSLRVLLRALGSKNEAHYNLRIADNRERLATPARPADSEPAPVEPAAEEEKDSPAVDEDAFAAGASDFARDDGATEEAEEEEKDDSLADKTKRELDDLNDLDI